MFEIEDLAVVPKLRVARVEDAKRDAIGLGIQLDINGSEAISKRERMARNTTATAAIKNSLLDCLIESMHAATQNLSTGKNTSI